MTESITLPDSGITVHKSQVNLTANGDGFDMTLDLGEEFNAGDPVEISRADIQALHNWICAYLLKGAMQ